MEHLYNPDQMSEQEIKDTFVARGPLVDRLVELIRHQPEGAGVQHVVLVAPRGMGKTTLLLMVQFAISERGLDPPWLAIRFPEEMYNITDLAEFWLETLDNVARTAADPDLAARTQTLKTRYRESASLQEAALTLLREWCRKHKRRLILLVDNFQMILSQINDEQQNAALRRVLMNEGFLMILGAAPSFFKEASAYDEPLYNFFKIEHLPRLTFDEMLALLSQRALADGRTDFEHTLDANTTRLKVLEYFTGGNARLVLLLYRVVAQSEVSEVRRGLELLLDEVTPYYKSKTEILPSQQRKIMDYVARRSGQIHEGISPSEIAAAVRLSPQVVSAQLRRLSEAGYVESANLRGRSTSYTLSERLYSLWYQMRFGRDARDRMAWLVEFLKGYYTSEELATQCHLLEARFHALRTAGSLEQARNALVSRRWMAEAMEDRSRYSTMEGVIKGFLTINDTDTLKDQVLANYQLENLSPDTLYQLVQSGCISQEAADDAQEAQTGSNGVQVEAEIRAAYLLAVEAYKQHQFEQSLTHLDRALELDPKNPAAWFYRGTALANLGRYDEALGSYDRALELEPKNTDAWFDRGDALAKLGRYEEALDSYDRVLELEPTDAAAWFNRANALAILGRHAEALGSYDRTLKLEPKNAAAWYNRGRALAELGRHEDALGSYDRALELEPKMARAWNNRGNDLANLGRHEEALGSYDRALELEPKNAAAWYNRGRALAELGRHEDALANLDRALTITAEDDESKARLLFSRFEAQMALGHPERAGLDWLAAVQTGGARTELIAYASGQLLAVARMGHLAFVRGLIRDSETEERFFPVARALDYLETGDAALIEKLTPEMRPLVENIVDMLRPVAEQGRAGTDTTHPGEKSKGKAPKGRRGKAAS